MLVDLSPGIARLSAFHLQRGAEAAAPRSRHDVHQQPMDPY